MIIKVMIQTIHGFTSALYKFIIIYNFSSPNCIITANDNYFMIKTEKTLPDKDKRDIMKNNGKLAKQTYLKQTGVWLPGNMEERFMKTGLRRGLVLGLTACMTAASLAGCAKEAKEFDPTETVLTMDGEEVSVGVANFLMRYQQAQFETYYGSMIQSLYGTDVWTTDLDGSGVNYGTTFKNEVMTGLEKMLLAEKHAADYGIELTEEETAAIAEAAQAFIAGNEEAVLTEMSATEENVIRVMTLYTIQHKVEQEMGADVDTEVSDEEAAQKTVTYVRFSPTSEPETETENETGTETEVQTEAAELLSAKERAEAFLEEAKATEDFAAAAEEWVANDADAGTSYFTFGEEDTFPDAAIIDAAWDIEEDGTLVEEVIEVNEDYYYVIYVDDAFDEEAVAAKKEEIISTRKLELVADIYDEWMEGVEFKVNEDVYGQLIYDIALTIVTETEATTEVETETVTEAVTEAGTEEVTEAATEVETEEATEAATEVETKEVTEAETEAAETETEK